MVDIIKMSDKTYKEIHAEVLEHFSHGKGFTQCYMCGEKGVIHYAGECVRLIETSDIMEKE